MNEHVPNSLSISQYIAVIPDAMEDQLESYELS